MTDSNAKKFTTPGITTTLANKTLDILGDRGTVPTTHPKFRSDDTQLTLQWYGNQGKTTSLIMDIDVKLKSFQMFELRRHQFLLSPNVQMW